MSDDTSLVDAVAEEVTDQIAVDDLLGDGDLEEQLDTGSIGASLGREFGAQIGRELGKAVGREIHAAISDGLEQGRDLGELVADAESAAVRGARNALDELDGSDSFASLLRGVGERDAGDQLTGAAANALTGDGERANDEPQADEPAADEAEAEDNEGEDEGGESDGEEVAENEPTDDSSNHVGADDLDDLRRDTLEDFLEVMSDEHLQSVARDVGVDADLSREEMTDQIVAEVAG
ncbi:hypothetical protein ACFOZ7_03855 [Natribaculum luteum]|uniref:Uncharacterized protein n=1 Tax=Natribaculum luteum TaxID=1586232 RepID=A0ABD5NWT6_9EURY|nr:hypothetical protein [Natribaculum luteum]